MRHPRVEALARRLRPARDRWRHGRAARRRSARSATGWLHALAALPGQRRRVRELARLEATLAARPVPEPAPRAVTLVLAETGRDTAAELGAATTDLVGLVDPGCRALDPAWAARLAAEVHGDVAAAVPALVAPVRRWPQARRSDGRLRNVGYDVSLAPDGTPRLDPRFAGRPPAPDQHPTGVAMARSGALVVSRRWLADAGGWRPLESIDATVLDLCERLTARGARIVAVPSAVLVDTRPPPDAAPPDAAWRTTVEHHGPALVRRIAGDTRPRVAISTAVPSRKVAQLWGDWHYAEGIARALRNLGARATVFSAGEHESLAARSCDLHVVLRGLRAVRRTPGQRHVLWIISHPADLDPAECDDADAVFVASERYAAHLRTRTRTPVHVMLQATDPERFRPVPAVRKHAHDIVVVAKTRDVLRPIVRDALAAGLRPRIYGSGWETFVDRELVVARHIENASLARVYSSAGVVLNDHWDDMRQNGFVSNRIFDALACGAPVVSDHLPEIGELFDGAVATYRGPAELRELVTERLADPAGARAAAARGRRIVLEHHTFEHRARTLLDHALLAVRTGSEP